jgi:glycosyltransferase involved in cell wall biosynthesis
MRVLHLNSLLTGGGTDDQCVKLCHGLRQVGVEATLAGPDGREFSRGARQLEVPFHVTPPEGPLKFRFILSAAKAIRRLNAQLVHGHHGRDLWPTILAARLSGRKPKIVLTRHLAKSPSSWFSRSFLLGQCDALIAVSQFVAQVLREGFYEPDSSIEERRSRPPLKGDFSKIRLVHGGIDTERFSPFNAPAQRKAWGLTLNDFAFAMIGGYDLPRGKGQREFLAAASKVSEKIPHARFLIVGRGNMKDILQADIEKLQLKGRAWLTEYCRDMPVAMNAMDCLVHPQIATEAFPGVVLEAFACGKPVIASALDGIPEAFAAGNVGQLVKPEAIDELGAALVDWARRPALTSQERSALHGKIAEGYSLMAPVRKVADLYRELCND